MESDDVYTLYDSGEAVGGAIRVKSPTQRRRMGAGVSGDWYFLFPLSFFQYVVVFAFLKKWYSSKYLPGNFHVGSSSVRTVFL